MILMFDFMFYALGIGVALGFSFVVWILLLSISWG